MDYRKPLVTNFGLKVALPSALAVMVIAFLLYTVINGLLAELGNADLHYARAAAQAFQSYSQDQLASVASDNAKWDEAAENTAGTANTEWLYETWGMVSTGDSYDTVVLLDGQGRTMAAFRDGVAVKQDAEDLLGLRDGVLPGLIANIDATTGVASDMSATAKDFRAIAIAEVRTSDSQRLPEAGRRYLLISNAIGESLLAAKGQLLGLGNLTIAKQALAGKVAAPVINASGETIGFWSWTNDNRADLARSRYGQVVWAILGSLIFVISILVNMSWKGFRDAHEVKTLAIDSALRDDLTGLPNRRQVINTLNEHLSKPYSDAEGLSLIFADLDGFKDVNDAYGHEVGDQLLKSAAGGFEYLAAGRGMVSRLGGDEFCLVISGPDAASNAREIAQNMRRFLAEPIVFGGRVASVSVSTGIVDRQPKDTGLDAEEFLRRADTAMYSAKSSGRNAIQIYDASLDNKREEHRRVARELRAHVDAHALHVVYQPIVDARNRGIVGVEALLRWPKDAPRNVTPDIFIRVAEEFGMIEEVGYFVMLEACRQAVHWPHLFMSVNVSPLQFMNPAFGDTVDTILRNTGLEPQRLEIEVTEGLIIDNADRVASILERLHRRGISVALDDFGTGYSSIGQLRRFHFDKLKLDRSMVADILQQPSALRLVQGTIAMADALGLRVTAEGIEDENQVSVLRLAGCSLFQGYLFSRPVEAYAISNMLEATPAALTA